MGMCFLACAAERGRPAVSFRAASPPEREDVRAAPCDPSPKRRKQRRGCRQDAPRPSEGIFPCSIEASARRNFPLLSRSSANRARQNRGAYKYTCRRFKISLLMSELRERALKSILRARQEAAEENLVFSSIRIMRLGGMCKIAHTLPRCQNSILSFEIPPVQNWFRLKNAKLSSSPGAIIHQFRGLIVEVCPN